MDKRSFMAVTALGGIALSAPVGAAGAGRSPVLLTVSGAIGKGNRGPVDPALDQLMVKQKITFDKAHTFEYSDLAALRAATVKPTLEYDNKRHTLSGPLLADVLKAAGAAEKEGTQLLMRAVDGYSPKISLADARRYGFIVATQLDGKPMPLGGLGPLWAVYEPDRFADMMAKPVSDRFALCPWGCFHIEVQSA